MPNKLLKTRIYQQDIESGPLYLLHRDTFPLTHFPHEAVSAGVHYALQRGLPLLPYSKVVAHVNESVALQEQLGLPHCIR